MKEILAAKYYLVEMEFSNDDKDPMKQLNIWLKATFIHDVLKCLSTDDKDGISYGWTFYSTTTSLILFTGVVTRGSIPGVSSMKRTEIEALLHVTHIILCIHKGLYV